MSYRVIFIGALLVILQLSYNADCIQALRDDPTTTSSGETEDNVSRLNSLKINTSDDDLYTNSISEEESEETINDDGKSARKDQTAQPEFNWIDHEEDHGIYSGRSLMSAASIVRRDGEAAEKDRRDPAIEGDDDYPAKEASKSSSYHLFEDSSDPLKTRDYAEREWQLMFRAFDSAYDSMSSSLMQELVKQTNLVEEIISNLGPECRRDVYHIRDSVRKHKLWALRMLDSNGKIPSGVSYGRFSSPGDYEECLSIRVNHYVASANRSSPLEHYKFHGKYCLLDFRLPLPEKPKDKLLGIHEPVLNLTGTDLLDRFPEMANYSAYASVFYEIGYMHAFCLPSTCQVGDLVRSMGRALDGLHIIVNNTVDCQEIPDEPLPLRRSQVISFFLFGLVFFNAALASVVYYLQPRGMKATKSDSSAGQGTVGRQRRPTMAGSDKDSAAAYAASKRQLNNDSAVKLNLRQRLASFARDKTFYVDCFSIQRNFERLVKPDPRGLAFVHYTRIVAMGLTVITHTAAMGTLQAITKPADASNNEQIFRDFLPQMLANAFSSIQIFFFMAGLMLVISTYPSIRRDKGHMSFVEYSLKRAIRLMPGLAATIGVNFLWPLFVDGPMLTYFIRIIVIPCESTWWRTLGFLSNFDHVEKMCLRHSYFSASDYQLHLMAFPLLALLYRQPTVAMFLAGLLTIGGFVAQVTMVLTKRLLPFVMVDYIDKDAFYNVVHYIHHPVWNHMSAFFYGFIIGYLVAKQIRVNLSDTTIKRIWLFVAPMCVASIYAPYYWNHYKRPIHRWQMVIYVIVDRFVLLTCCAWISYSSMVLAQRPRAQNRRATKQPNELEGKTNLPSIVTLENKEQKEQETEGSGGLHAATPGLQRQRSSPNFEKPHEFLNQLEQRRVSRTLSSIDLTNLTAKGPSQPDENKEGQSGEPNQAKSAQQSSQRKEQAQPIAKVNALCLMLSRLTFQLYLFNMVVLWFDVNHSKYYWFFSYYFIITKALAVYVCSTILALVFFITLESPCLTLYIAWVKSRAVARARKQVGLQEKLAATEKQSTANQGGDAAQPAPISMNPLTRSPGSTVSGQSTHGSSSYDGLCMRSSSTSPKDHRVNTIVKPTFSFIDLSSKPAADEDQTRM